MKVGNLKFLNLAFAFYLLNVSIIFAADKIESLPLINLEELSPTFEEDKDELEKIDESDRL